MFSNGAVARGAVGAVRGRIVGDMRRIAAVILVASGSSMLAGRAFADDKQGLTLQATMVTTYDSNVAESSAAVAAQRGITPQDEILQPGVDIDLSIPLGREQLFVKGTAGYSFYVHNSVLSSQSIDLQGGLKTGFRSCKATLANEFENARTELQDLTASVTRNIETTDTIRLDAACGDTTGFGPTVSISQQWSNNSAPQLVASDFRETTVSAGLAYRRPLLGEVSLFGSYSQSDFPNRDLSTGPGSIQDGYREYGGGVSYDRRIGGHLEGAIRLSYTTLDPYVQGVQGYSGLDIRGDVSLRVSPRLQAHLTVEHGPSPTIVSNSTYTLTTMWSADVDYEISPRLSIKIGGMQSKDRYNGAALVPGVDIQRETISTVTAATHYQFSRRLHADLTYTHETRSADIAAYDYDDDRVGLSLSVTI